jgi:hypothetical protein
MSDEFPSNSHSQRRPAREPREEKKVERIVSGEVVRRKKPLGRRFKETFMGGDSQGVASYVMLDILVPAAKDMFADAVSMGVEKLVFGESRSASRRGASRYSSPLANHTPYRAMGSSRLTTREDPRGPSRRSRANHNFDEIILATRVEAEEVVDRLFDLIQKYNSATVQDLYDTVGISGNYTDNKWGWTDLRGAGVSRIREGYLLDLPKPEPLD